jgi:NhaP-type Na+/H+ or K+/H+ antiporter
VYIQEFFLLYGGKMITFGMITTIIILGGWLFSKAFTRFKLPNVLGMVVFGILCSLFLKDHTTQTLWEIAPFAKSMALIVILLRAGLGIRRETLAKSGLTAILMTFVPCIVEGSALTIAFHLVFKFDWAVSGLTAFLLSAVSPAVIVPSMLKLIDKGYGKKREVPTIILAGASIDDVFAITVFSAFLGVITTHQFELTKTLLTIPTSIIGGILLGVIAGFILVKFYKMKENLRATEKMLILLSFALLLDEIGDFLHVAALLGVMTVGFIILEKQEETAHKLAAKLGKIWIFAEIVLFVLIGFSVDPTIALSAGLKGILVISIGLIFRSIGVLLATTKSGLTVKEKIFCVIAYLPKATVQAALGSVALNKGIPEGNEILAIAVLSILFTAPLGLLLINMFGKKLLDVDFN